MMKQYLKLEVETTKTGNTFTSLDLSKRTERQETNNNDGVDVGGNRFPVAPDCQRVTGLSSSFFETLSMLNLVLFFNH
jgi:hypothetical protein